MKQNYFFLILLFISSTVIYSQTSELLEDESVGSASFTDNGQVFNISSSAGETYDVLNFTGAGWNGSSADNQFIDNTSGNNGNNNGSSFTISAQGGVDFTIESLYLFCANSSLGAHTGTVTFEGFKDGSPTEVYTFTRNSSFSSPITFSPFNGFTFINFASDGASDFTDDPIDQLVITSTGNLDYMALDAFRWDTVASDSTPPTVQSIALSGTPNTTDDMVDFIVTFNENASNVTTDDFELDVSGAMATISSISGSGTTYTVTTNAISGEGTLSIDLKANTDIIDDTGNGNGTNGNVAAFTTGATHTVSSCFLESFEGTSNGDTAFTGNGVSFTVAGGIDIETIANGAAGNSSKFLSNDGAGTGTYTISSMTNFTIKSLDLYLSSIMNGSSPTNDGSITINGKLGVSTVYTITKSTSFPTSVMNGDNGFSNISFATEGAADYSTTTINSLEITLGGSFVYIGIDHFEFCEEGIMDTDAPDVVGITVAGTPTSIATSVDFTVTFDENVTNVTADDFSIDLTGTATGTISGVVGSNNIYTVTVNGIDGEGTVSIDLNASTDIEDTLMNSGTPAFTMGGIHEVSECLIETFEGFTAAATTFTSNGVAFNATGGLDIFNLNMGGVNNSDQFLDNEGSGAGTFSIETSGDLFSVNKVFVYLSSIAAATSPTDDGTLIIRGLKAMAEEFSVTLDNINTTFLTSAAQGNNGFLEIDFSSLLGADYSTELIDELEFEIGGSFLYLGVDNFEFCQDTTAPTVTISSTETSPTSANPVPITVTFSEDVTGFDQMDLSVTGGAVSDFATTSASEYTFNVTPSATLFNSTITVNIVASVAQDLVGINNEAATEFNIEALAAALHNETADGDLSNNANTPTVLTFASGTNRIIGSVTTSAPADTRDYITFTIPSGMQLSQILLQNYDDPSTMGANDGNRGFHVIDEGATTFQPGSGDPNDYLGGAHLDPLTPGTDVLAVLAGAPLAGSGFTAPLQAGTYTYAIQQTGSQVSVYTLDFILEAETIAPSVAITSSEADPTSNSSFSVTITFSEAVTGFVSGDITVGNGAASNLATTDNIVFTADITPAADGNVTVDIAADVADDTAGNGNTAATQFSIVYSDPTLGIEDNTLSTADFSFANPVSDTLIIETSIEIASIQLYNLNGEMVSTSNGNTVDISILASGLYIAYIVTEDGLSTTIKVVKK